MNTEMLLKEFREILVHEERAKAFYDHYIDQLQDEGVKSQLSAIRDDEVTHIKIARMLIESVL